MDNKGWRNLRLETLPRCLFKNNVDYFCLYLFIKGPSSFHSAKRSRERHLGYHLNTMMGYLGYRLNMSQYRGERPFDPRVKGALWWRPFDKTSCRHSKQPFRLTQRGLDRACRVYDRVCEFLFGLVSDLGVDPRLLLPTSTLACLNEISNHVFFDIHASYPIAHRSTAVFRGTQL